MARSFIAGDTSYENQSLEDIKTDIKDWLRVSEEVKREYSSQYNLVIQSELYNKIPYNYKSFLNVFGSIVDANIEDFKLVLDSINDRCITESRVNLFIKIGEKSIENFDKHKSYFYSEKYDWHKYGDTNFDKVEELYALIGDYLADLWDVTNAGNRLKDYIDSTNNESIVADIDNSIKIGDKNKINDVAIGHSSKNLHSTKNSENSWFSSVSSGIVATVIGGIILAVILLYLGLSN